MNVDKWEQIQDSREGCDSYKYLGTTNDKQDKDSMDFDHRIHQGVVIWWHEEITTRRRLNAVIKTITST